MFFWEYLYGQSRNINFVVEISDYNGKFYSEFKDRKAKVEDGILSIISGPKTNDIPISAPSESASSDTDNLLPF